MYLILTITLRPALLCSAKKKDVSSVVTYTIPTHNRIPTIIFAFRFICKFHKTKIGRIPNRRSVTAEAAEYAIAIAWTCGAGRHFPGRPEN
jgi:hypothetical protein